MTVTDIGEGENVKQMYLLTFSFSAQLVSICFAGTDIDALKFFEVEKNPLVLKRNGARTFIQKTNLI